MDELLNEAFSDLLASPTIKFKQRSELIDIVFDTVFRKGRPANIRASSVTAYVDRFLDKLVKSNVVRRVRQGVYAFGPTELLNGLQTAGQVIALEDALIPSTLSRAFTVQLPGQDIVFQSRELERYRDENESLNRQLAEAAAAAALPSTLRGWIEHEYFFCIQADELTNLLALQGMSL